MRRRRHDRALPHPQAGGMALRRPRRAAAGVGAVRRAADARPSGRAKASRKSGCRAATTCRCAACRSRSKQARRRAFSCSTPRAEYGRIELEVSLAEDADFELYRRQHRRRPVDQRDRHQRQAHRRRRTLAPDDPQRCSTARRSAPISARSRSRAARRRPTPSSRSKPCCSTAARPPTASPSSRFSPTT